MSEGFANCFCGQPRVNPPLNPSAGQSRGWARAGVCGAKLVVLTRVAAASTAAVKHAFDFMIVCPPNSPYPLTRNLRFQRASDVTRARGRDGSGWAGVF